MQFSKNFPLPKNGGHFKFSNFCQKWQNTNLCEIERFRRNFRPTGYLRNVIFAIFKKFSPPQKMAAILRIFEFLPKMAKHKFASISLTVRDRAISSKFSTHRVSKECNLCNFPKIFPSPKNGGHFEFSNFCQKWQNTNLLLSP